MKKHLFRMLITLVMVLGLLPGLVYSVHAESTNDVIDKNQDSCNCICGYTANVDHVNDDGNTLCDVCPFEYHDCYSEDNNHYCDKCDAYMKELCTDTVYVDHTCDNSEGCALKLDWLCTDTDNNHHCDLPACNYYMSDLCEDEDNNHVCDNSDCDSVHYWLCFDEDNDHTCDITPCGRYMSELCRDDDGDLYCDGCSTLICDHYNYILEKITENTHLFICTDCGESWDEECWDTYNPIIDEHTHKYQCPCGNEFWEEEHTFNEEYIYSRSFAGHLVECDEFCGYAKFEKHTEATGTCDQCGIELTELHDIYVGEYGLMDGEYLDLNGNISETKPDGGYAYYKDGVLELNDYVYEGKGVLYVEDDFAGDYSYFYHATIFTVNDLTIKLVGENSLKETATDIEMSIDGDGISSFGDLTITGTGTLTILAGNDGINVDYADFTMEGGTLKLGILEWDEDGYVVTNNEIGDDGIDVYCGDVYINGGTLIINSDDHSLDVDGNVTVSGGIVDVTADDDGFNVESDIMINGGTITVDADDYGFDSDAGSITIKGGTINIIADDYDGITAPKNVTISGGDITIDADDHGIVTGKIIINGGDLEITSKKQGIFGTLILGEGVEIFDENGNPIENPDFTSLKDVVFETKYILGDINMDTAVDVRDSLLLFQHILLPNMYQISYTGSIDFTGDSTLDINDVLLLFRHSMLPDFYPLF